MANYEQRNCPYCGKKLKCYSTGYWDKHIERCKESSSLHFYNGKGPGRPSKKAAQKNKEVRDRMIKEMHE